LSRFQSAGLINKWLGDILFEASLKIPSKDKKRSRERPLSLDNMKLCYLIFFGGHFCAFVAFSCEQLIHFYIDKKDDIIALVRKLSIIPTGHGDNPDFIITNADSEYSDTQSLDDVENGRLQKNGSTTSVGSQERRLWLYPPLDAERMRDEEE